MKVKEKTDLFIDLTNKIKLLTKIEIDDILINIRESLEKDNDVNIDYKEVMYSIIIQFLNISKDFDLEKDIEQFSIIISDIYLQRYEKMNEEVLNFMLGWIYVNLTKMINNIEKEKIQKIELKKIESDGIDAINNILNSEVISNDLKMILVQHNLQFITKPVCIDFINDTKNLNLL